MPELLTESFCERCGTRYTFEAAHQRVRLKGVKTLSRGLKNFVMSDDTSLDEAMAAARNETDREVTGHQLDAFHQTFNFCMSCRQYTCPNCWNEAEARCLSCAPHLGHEILPAPFPDMDPMTGLYPGAVEMEPEAGIAAGSNGSNGSNGHGAVADLAALDAMEGATDGGADIAEIDAISRLASLTAASAVVDASDADEAVEERRRGRSRASREAEPPLRSSPSRLRPRSSRPKPRPRCRGRGRRRSQRSGG